MRSTSYVFESEGIELDKSSIQKNAAKRRLATVPPFILGQVDGIE
jgi:hypothetical protein